MAFATPQTITLPAQQILNPAGGALTIAGPGPHLLKITNSSATRLFFINTTGTNLTLSGLTLTGGADAAVGGGAIKITMTTAADSCSLTLTNCIITNNTTGGNGGALHCAGGPLITVNVTDCLFSNNTAAGFGGAMILNSNTVSTPNTFNFTNTSFIGNTATGSAGGAIHNTNSPINATFKNCTFHGNSAPNATNGQGGAVRVGNGSTLSLVNCTVTGNSAGNVHGGLFASGTSTWTLRNTIVAGNSGPTSTDVGATSGTYVSAGGNLIGNNTGAPAPFNVAGNPNGSNDRVGTGASPIVPIVSPPGNHGGTAWTRALLSGSPGIDQGITAPSTGLTTDARGATRIVGSVEDIGAFERSAAPADFTAASLPPGKAGDPYSYTLATGATGFTYTVTNGSLPSPLALNNSSGTVTIAGTPAASGTSTFQITISNGTNDVVVQYQLVVGAGAGPTPSVTVPGGTTTLTTTTSGTPGGSVSFSITGANLTGAPGNLTVTAPTNVEVSADNVTFGGTASIPYSSATLAPTPVFVRLAGTGSVGPISGNVSINGGGLSAAVTQAVSGTLNPAPVAVTSLNTVNTTPTNAATVNWTLTFPSAVTGVTASNFTLTGPAAAGLTVGTPAIASGGGLTWNIPVATGATDGLLTLNLVNATGLSATLSNVPFTGQSYTIDKTPPTVLSVTRLTPLNQTTNLTTLTFRVTYSEPVNLNAPAASRYQVVPVGGSSIVGTVQSVTGAGNIRDVTVNLTSGTGEFRLRVID